MRLRDCYYLILQIGEGVVYDRERVRVSRGWLLRAGVIEQAAMS